MKSKHWKRNMMKFFQGASMGTVVGVIPSAILGTVTAPYVGETGLLGFFARVVVAFQFAVPFLVGYFTALEFQLSAIETAVLVGSSFIGSGILKFSGGSWILQGTGDSSWRNWAVMFAQGECFDWIFRPRREAINNCSAADNGYCYSGSFCLNHYDATLYGGYCLRYLPN